MSDPRDETTDAGTDDSLLDVDGADDTDGSTLRVDLSDGEGPELTVGGNESSDSVAPRPGR